MLSKPTQQELLAMALLSRAPEGQKLLGFLDKDLARLQDMLLTATDQTFKAIQGQAVMLKEVIELLRDAPDQFEKARNHRQ